ncbi:MAG: virS 15 [Myxococcaceae bacterium]|nr:virS 15 [Myxococcaceae bacterium]
MFVSVLFVRGILAELSSRGHTTAEVVRGVGISPDVLCDLRARIPCGDLERLIARAVLLSGDPGLGLTLGEKAPESMLQILGYLLLSCRTLRDAFAALERYAALTVDGAGWRLTELGDSATFAYECPLTRGVGARFTSEFVLAMGVRIARHFIPQTEMHVEQVLFRHEAPAYEARYQRVFSAPVRFEQADDALVFPRHFLDVQQFHADDVTNWALRDTADRVLETLERPSSLSERIRGILRSDAMLAALEVDQLARSIGLTRRALRRRLAAEGTSLTSLVDEARCRLACEELRRDGSVRTISERMGYSEPSAFYRAFRRWTGQTPSEFVRRA